MSASANEPFDETLLSAYLDQELDASERAMVERELEKSPELRALFAELSQIRNLVATCNIPLASESKAISGPWESSSTTDLVRSTPAVATQSAWTTHLPRLASLAAAIALLLGLGAIVVWSTSSGRWIAYQPTNEKVAKREASPSPAPSASAPSYLDPSVARSVPATSEPESLASSPKRNMATEASDLPTNSARFSLESPEESLEEKFIQFLNGNSKTERSSVAKDKSLANDVTEVSGLFRVQAMEPLLRSKRQSNAREQVVELIIPEEKWEAAKALLFKKGFAMERMLGSSGDVLSAESLAFRATVNRLSPAEWTIVAANDEPTDKDIGVVELKESETKFRKIRVTLTEETTKSSSDE
jgi:hypothetical protein